jgi:hypothetical protein
MTGCAVPDSLPCLKHGREDQASLTALAAAKLGWQYPRLLLEMLSTAVPLQQMRDIKAEEGG